MPDYVVQRAGDVLKDVGTTVRGARVLLIGVAYKPNIGDVRESPAIEVAGRLRECGAVVRYVDPFVAALTADDATAVERVDLTAAELEASDLVLITTAHDDIDWDAGPRTRTARARHAWRARSGPAGVAHALGAFPRGERAPQSFVKTDIRRPPKSLRCASGRRDAPAGVLESSAEMRLVALVHDRGIAAARVDDLGGELDDGGLGRTRCRC